MVNGEINFPCLEIAAKRLGLDMSEMFEAVLSGLDAGYSEREAVTMTIIEILQRRGAYHGRLKQVIDDGTIFQIADDERQRMACGDVHHVKGRTLALQGNAVREGIPLDSKTIRTGEREKREGRILDGETVNALSRPATERESRGDTSALE